MAQPSRAESVPRTPASRSNTSLVNAVLGLWLACSALLWCHPPPQRANALITGAVIVAASLASVRRTRARYLASIAAI
jgi:hypothetical protein